MQQHYRIMKTVYMVDGYEEILIVTMGRWEDGGEETLEDIYGHWLTTCDIPAAHTAHEEFIKYLLSLGWWYAKDHKQFFLN